MDLILNNLCFIQARKFLELILNIRKLLFEFIRKFMIEIKCRIAKLIMFCKFEEKLLSSLHFFFSARMWNLINIFYAESRT
jgi:hypothetical protein